MKNPIPINTEKSANAVMEILLRLKVRDAMQKKIYTATPEDSLRTVQHIMKDKKISGVPIVEGQQLVGIVSVNDIINALDGGYIENKVKDHMVTNLIVLEDDMPLSFALSFFNKFSYRRFPVIDRDKKLVGILTSRDILSALVSELNKEIKTLENRIKDKSEVSEAISREFIIKRYDFEHAGQASFELKRILKDKKIPPAIIRRASIASYELEMNIVIHSVGGKMRFVIDDKKIETIAKDDGPGIADIEAALREGFSTASEWIRSLGFGAGMGLPNTKRVSDEFHIFSEVGKGTEIQSIIYLEGKP
ncbi:CBS domain-containing protein [Thermospira aquatica]|uniref:CBS domain-containing protein n=1 Tax=Thermospira aquatica TaxID=2828656 RepID=A0AAX3BAK6_9SPIR|nr:CBS domain-containing protein [Thermospira aquatica]URA09307.1 CBS domain-containing protein [Thermospira aquatica]